MSSNQLKKVFYKNDNEHFEFLFAGDTSFCENFQERRKENGGTSILESNGYGHGLEKLRPLMKNADFVAVNLEATLTDCKESPFESCKTFIHWTHIEKAPLTLLEHNVSLVSLANNHTFDYGTVGFNQSLEVLREFNLPAIGAGKNISEAGRPFICEINFKSAKIRVAIIAAYSEVFDYREIYKVYATPEKPGIMPLDVDLIANQVKEIKSSDPKTFVILFPHWGVCYKWCSTEQMSLSKRLFSCGVDLIIGHGAHMIQEIENFNSNLVIYSLGNFVFQSKGRYNQFNAPPYSFVASLNIKLEKERPDFQLKLYPIITNNNKTNYQPRFLNKDEFDDLEKVLLKREIMKGSESLLIKKQDNHGYHYQLPIVLNEKQE